MVLPPQYQRPFVCPVCGKLANAAECGVAVWNGKEYDYEADDEVTVDPPHKWTLVQCDACHMPSVELRLDYGKGYTEPEIVYPAPRTLSADVPFGLRREWEEARNCFSSKAYTACVVMVGRILEGTCAEQGSKKRTLALALKELESKGIIDGTLVEWADALRVIRNIGAHYTRTPVSRQDAEDALAFAEALLDHIYVLQKRFVDFKARLDT